MYPAFSPGRGVIQELDHAFPESDPWNGLAQMFCAPPVGVAIQ